MNLSPELTAVIAMTLGVGWASGINLYALILALGLAGNFGYVELPSDLQILQDPIVIAAAGFMYAVEFFADKTPGVDTIWDTIHTFIRLPAGALLAAGASGALGDIDPGLQMAAGLVGGSLAATSHAAKAGTRALANTSPEPFSNWVLSFSEDILVVIGTFVMILHPELFLFLLILFVAFAIWLMPKVWRALRSQIQRISNWISPKQPERTDQYGETQSSLDRESDG